MVMLHELPWLSWMVCPGYVVWVTVAMLFLLLWSCCVGCRSYVVLFRKTKSTSSFGLGWEFDNIRMTTRDISTLCVLNCCESKIKIFDLQSLQGVNDKEDKKNIKPYKL